MSDLEACCNRQLLALGGTVEEVLGVDRKAIKVFSKIIESLRYKVCTIFGINEKPCRGKGCKLVGIGQGNMLLGTI